MRLAKTVDPHGLLGEELEDPRALKTGKSSRAFLQPSIFCDETFIHEINEGNVIQRPVCWFGCRHTRTYTELFNIGYGYISIQYE